MLLSTRKRRRQFAGPNSLPAFGDIPCVKQGQAIHFHDGLEPSGVHDTPGQLFGAEDLTKFVTTDAMGRLSCGFHPT